MTLNQQIEQTIAYLSGFNKDNEITLHLKALRDAKIILKKWWKPRDVATRMTYSTTFSDHEIHLGIPWPYTTAFRKARWLLHEAVHLLQYQEMDRRIYWLAYINPFNSRFRKRMELEADYFTKKIMGV